LPQGSCFPFGSSLQILRPPPLLSESTGRSFGQSGGAVAQSQAASSSHLALDETIAPSALSPFPRPLVEENLSHDGPGDVPKGLPKFL